jgi:hypothetical protein
VVHAFSLVNHSFELVCAKNLAQYGAISRAFGALFPPSFDDEAVLSLEDEVLGLAYLSIVRSWKEILCNAG